MLADSLDRLHTYREKRCSPIDIVHAVGDLVLTALHSVPVLWGDSLKKILAAALVATLSACASTQTVMNRPADMVYHSTSSANQVAFCLANKNNTSALDRDDGSKVVLIKNGYGGVSMAFAVYPEGTGSKIEYRKAFGTIGGIWRQCIGPEAEHKAG